MGGCIIKDRKINQVVERFGHAGKNEKLSSPQIVQSTKAGRRSDNIKWVKVTSQAWAVTTAYVVGNKRSTSDGLYYCISDHTSTAADKPESGANWATYWELSDPMQAKDAVFNGSTWSTSGDDFDVYRYPQSKISFYNNELIMVFKSGGYWVALSNVMEAKGLETLITTIVKSLFDECP